MNTSDYITIPLTKGQETIVDPVDADLAQLKWHSQSNYAGRWASIKGGQERNMLLLHRIVLGRKLNRELDSNEHCDHIDGNPLNNRRENLRLATPRENSRNKKVDVRNTSGYTGVCFDRGRNKWRADIKLPHQRKFLGHFRSFEDAVQARKEAEKLHYGEFVRKID